MNRRNSSSDDRKLNVAIIVCIAVVLVATVVCVLVQKLPAQSGEPEQNDTGVLITDENLPVGGQDVSVPSASDTAAPETTTTTETTTAATTTATTAPVANSAYDVTIKDSAAVRQTLTQIMSEGDLALLDSILSSGTNTASESSSESTYDVNGQLCIVDSEMQAVKYEYYVPGAGERVILVCAADGRVYVGLVTGSQMHYYTNDAARVANAPKCISGYASALSLEMKNLSA